MSNLTCPKCHGAMRTYERNGVHIDQCGDCRGIFLDRGELEHLIDAESRWQAPAAPQASAPPPASYGKPYDKHRRRKSFLEELFD